MFKELLDLYTDYLILSFSQTTATGLSKLLDNKISHDKITRFLGSKTFSQRDYWQQVKPLIRQIETEIGIIVIDDTIEEKPHTDENEIVCYHYDHTKGRSIKGINILNFLYYANNQLAEDISIPLTYKIVSKTEKYVDKKTGKNKRRSKITKNEMVRERLRILTNYNKVEYQYIAFDIWFSSKENMECIKKDLKKDFVCALKSNRTLALSYEEKLCGNFKQVSDLDIKPGKVYQVYLKGLSFPVNLVKQVFTNKDGSTGTLYLVTSDTNLNYNEIISIYQKRWKVETFHKSLKQNASLEKSPTKIERTQKNHIFTSMLAFIKLEMLKLKTNLNHFALKDTLYLKAIKTSYNE